jgi:hypothetical protein
MTRKTAIWLWHEDLNAFMLTSRSFLLRMRTVRDKSCRENRNTHFTYSNFIPENRTLWNYVEKYGRARWASDENRIRRMRIACWITKATDTHSEYVILTAFPLLSLVAQTRLDVNVYTYMTCLIRIFLVLLCMLIAFPFFCPAFICVV